MKKLAVAVLSALALTAHAEQHTYTYRVEFAPVRGSTCWAAGWVYDGNGGQYGIDPSLGTWYTVPVTGSLVLENNGNYDCCEYNHQRILMGHAWQEISTDGGPWQALTVSYVSVYLPLGAMEGYYYVTPTYQLSTGTWMFGCP